MKLVKNPTEINKKMLIKKHENLKPQTNTEEEIKIPITLDELNCQKH
jgi:hypothetical protein